VLIGAGELMHKDSAPAIPVPAAVAQASPIPEQAQPISQTATATEPLVASQQTVVSPERGVIAVRDTTSKPTRASRPELRRVSLKRSSSSAAAVSNRRSAARPARRDVWDRLKLGWLRNAFSSSSRSSL
jgi:hypothetical protein